MIPCQGHSDNQGQGHCLMGGRARVWGGEEEGRVQE